jgi:hypothetical protein
MTADAKKKCPKCKRKVTVRDGILCTHGPGPNDEFICPGSGDKAMVKATKGVKVPGSRPGPKSMSDLFRF